MATRQLERADLYLVAIENLGLEDPAIADAVRQLRADLEALARLINKPRLWRS